MTSEESVVALANLTTTPVSLLKLLSLEEDIVADNAMQELFTWSDEDRMKVANVTDGLANLLRWTTLKTNSIVSKIIIIQTIRNELSRGRHIINISTISSYVLVFFHSFLNWDDFKNNICPLVSLFVHLSVYFSNINLRLSCLHELQSVSSDVSLLRFFYDIVSAQTDLLLFLCEEERTKRSLFFRVTGDMMIVIKIFNMRFLTIYCEKLSYIKILQFR